MYNDEIIDSHMHLWDKRNNYSWLESSDVNLEKMLGDYSSLRTNFLVPDYIKLAKANKIIQSIHVEAFGFPEDPVNETKWLQEQANKYGFPNGIVAYAKLDEANIEEILYRHTRFKNMRGIRMVLNWHDVDHLRMTDRPDYMKDKNWLNGFSLLEKYNLSFDLQVFDHQLADAKHLALEFPNTQIILEHLAWPTDLTPEGFVNWQKNIASIAACSNVVVKLSCFGCAFQRKVSEQVICKYIKATIDAFGPDRCLFGSNFPPDSLFYKLDEVITLVKKASEHLGYEAQRKIFFSNAKRIYRLT
ncbi:MULTISPECIES: amidohydrolase family protein [Francisella]|uniref:Amidohydrolase-related domain-containing protein n=1 Tax=Francisella opportunistica TaxID=2016517 RepID=A0A345JP44_9GAMM|nr:MULTISPECIES: amidohydrolase family protein [Francisella]APC90746.1 hypothetical protein BBG19_0006 [Francisella sp. MA067296]AXH29090.1 hypothetical protein CGC43_00035 [Francisella opportunistica]AXH30743.1 hypothetical protein CGC44_00035 [Francisella opportunistica]AXH32389.1 hypothetical protein CGC45_00035 [Francisella opportunistica]